MFSSIEKLFKKKPFIKTYWAYVEPNQKFFIITRYKNDYKGYLLLFKLGCVSTDKNMYIPDKTMPVVGTICYDCKGRIIEVVSCEWI